METEGDTGRHFFKSFTIFEALNLTLTRLFPLAVCGQGVEDELQMDEAEEMNTQQERNEQEAGRLTKRGEFTLVYSPSSLS